MGSAHNQRPGGASVSGGAMRPMQSTSSAERSGSIEAERILSKLNNRPRKGPPMPTGNAVNNSVPRGKAQY